MANAEDARAVAKAQTRATAAAAAVVAASSQPSMLRRLGGGVLETVVTRLLVLRARSVPISLLIGAIMLILARSDATDRLFGKPQIAALVDAFYQVLPALSSINEAAAGEEIACGGGNDNAAERRSKPRQFQRKKRRRGRLARRVATGPAEGDGGVMLRVRGLLSECGLEPSVTDGIGEDPFGVATVYGLALAGLLETTSAARETMIERHRVHRIVAVLVESEKRCRAPDSSEAAVASSRAIAAVSLRILEFATLHHGCQDVITRESKVVEAAVSVMRLRQADHPSSPASDSLSPDVVSDVMSDGENEHSPDRQRADNGDGEVPGRTAGVAAQGTPPPLVPLHDELVLADALRLCVNLTHECRVGLAQFVVSGGVGVVLDLMACPAVWPRAGVPEVEKNPLRETFDVRVLSIALLASVVAQDKNIGAAFQQFQPRGVVERDGGAVAFVLELLKVVGERGPSPGATTSSLVDARGGDATGDVEAGAAAAPEVGGNHGEASDEDVMITGDCAAGGGTVPSAESGDSSPAEESVGGIGMDKRVMTGYLCLLLGALVAGSAENRTLVLSAMPDNSLIPIADVLDEFLMFHHELGVVSSSVDDMYASIIESLRRESRAPATDALAAVPDTDWLNSDIGLGDCVKD